MLSFSMRSGIFYPVSRCPLMTFNKPILKTMPKLTDIANALKECAENSWSERGTPLLLSNVHFLLVNQHPDYREALAGRTLKEFVQETGSEFGYKLVAHPTQKAKVAVLPVNVEYEFPAIHEREPQSPRQADVSADAVIAFLKKLATLTPEEIDRVNIPTSILVKLLR